MEKVTLLIDGDVVVYKATAAVEQEIAWEEDLHTLHSNPEEAQEIIINQLSGWQSQLDASDVVVAFSDSHNFRKDVYPLYKSNRKDKRKPVAYKSVKQWVTDNWTTYVRPSLEGDDILGILSTSQKIIRGQKIIISVDKDFKTIPGYFFNPDKDVQPVFITQEAADYMHMYQTLTGDATDGYPGLPGCGPKGAEKVLEDDPSWEAVVEAYIKKGLTEEDALTQARCARILRAEDYDFKNKEVRLWLPTERISVST
jgi:DNA polymerase-1